MSTMPEVTRGGGNGILKNKFLKSQMTPECEIPGCHSSVWSQDQLPRNSDQKIGISDSFTQQLEYKARDGDFQAFFYIVHQHKSAKSMSFHDCDSQFELR